MKKKILSLMLAVVMLLSLGVTAGASTVTATSGTEEVTLKKTYTINNGTAPTETFYLVQVESGTVTSSTTSSAPNLDYTTTTVSGTSYNVVATVDLGGATNTSGNFTIGLPSYSYAGVYTYALKEVPGDTEGVTYYDGTLYLVVYVTNGTGTDSGKLVVSQTNIYKGSIATANKTDTIENVYEAGSLSVSKSVTGNTGDKTEEFIVTVTFKSDDTVNSVISYTVDGIDQTITAGWTGTKEVTIYLQDGETITFSNIPAGVTYTVVENDYTNEGYKTAVYDNSDTSLTISSGDSDTVKITNEREADVDTGVILDSLPYILILIVVAAGAVVMITRKRRNEDL